MRRLSTTDTLETPAGFTRGCRLIVAGFSLQLALPVGQLLIVVGIVQPATLILLTVSASTAQLSTDVTATQVAIRAALTSLWAMTVWGTGGILRDDVVAGTLEMMVVRPTDPRLILLGRSLGNGIRVGAIIVLVSLASVLALGHRPVIADPVLMVAGLALMLITATATGLVLSAVLVVVRAANRVQEVLMYPVFVFGGLLIPLATLPPILRPLSTIIPFRWVAEVTTAAVATTSMPTTALGVAAALTIAYLIAGWWLFGVILRRAAQRGGFAHG